MKNILSKLTGILLIVSINMGLSAQKISRDLNVDLLINHAGYTPGASKTVVTKGQINGKFDVVDISSMEIAYSGSLKTKNGDFGSYSSGDFSSLRKLSLIHI